MRILNLYAGIGGNRALWGNDHEITAVEQCPHIAGIYRERFPMDRLLVEDAHQYLLNHFTKFDFIWSSPPCQSHGQCRFNLGVKLKGYAPLYPDMTLYQEILLLRHHFAGRWIVENTVPYYEPLIAPTAKLGRHLVWSNFAIPPVELKPSRIRDKSKIEDFDGHEDVSASKIPNKRQALRNAVDPELGLHALRASYRTPVASQSWPHPAGHLSQPTAGAR